MSWQDWIECNPDVLGGKPVARGTRIPVDLLLHRLAGGWTIDEVLASFPHLRKEHIHAALDYAAGSIGDDGNPPPRLVK